MSFLARTALYLAPAVFTTGLVIWANPVLGTPHKPQTDGPNAKPPPPIPTGDAQAGQTVYRIYPGYRPTVIAQRKPPMTPVQNAPGTFDEKMVVIDASGRGGIRGNALPLLLDLARKPKFLHDDSVNSLEALLDPQRGATAPHPFYAVWIPKVERNKPLPDKKGMANRPCIPRLLDAGARLGVQSKHRPQPAATFAGGFRHVL